MQIHRVGYGVRGFWKLNDYAIRYVRMVTDEAKKRAAILEFWERYGLEAAVEAFKLSRRTLYSWKAKRKAGKGRMESLNAGSRKPKRLRRRLWPVELVREIKILRTEHPNIGKDKVRILIEPFCVRRGLPCPSVSTVGRLIADAPGRMRTEACKPSCAGKRRVGRRPKKTRKPKGFRTKRPGHCVSFDSVERIVGGLRRYVVTATDVHTRFSLAFATASHGSQAAADVLRVFQEVFPHPVEHVLTDNGSEFMKRFNEELDRREIPHWHTYPRTPKMNAHSERFNRTLQEEFLDRHSHLLQDPKKFNGELADWLVWYNSERPHRSLGLKSPIQYMAQLNPRECNMWWAPTTV